MSRPNSHPSIWISALALCSLFLAGSPGCGSDPSSPDEPKDANVSVESSNRVQGTIGPEGGTLTTTSDAGIEYALEIPAGALPAEVTIAMTPVSSIKGSPYSGGIEGAVQLGPSGLVPVRPALLTIGTTATPAADQKLVGFSYEGDASAFEITAAVQTGAGIRVLVPHFSGAGTAVANAATLPACPDPNIENLPWNLMCIPPAAPDARERFIEVMRTYLNDVVVPAIDAATGDELRLVIVTRYLYWESFINEFADAYNASDATVVLETDIVAAKQLMAQKVAQAIAVAKERCVFTGSIEPVRLIFEFQFQVLLLELDSFGPGLDRESINQGICATVVIDSVSLANPLPLNADRSLDARFALEINGVRQSGGLFEATVTGDGASVQNPTGRTNAGGEYTTVVRRTSEDEARFTVRGCLMLTLFEWNSTSESFLKELPICAEKEVVRRGDGALVILTSRYSSISALAGGNCEADDRDLQENRDAGPATISASAEVLCQADGEQARAVVSHSQSADPGVAPDKRSALLTFSSSGTASHEVSASRLARAAAGGNTEFRIGFEVKGGEMDFQLDASASFTAPTDLILDLSLVDMDRFTGYGWHKESSDGNPTEFFASGKLLPGRYEFYIGYLGQPKENTDVGARLATFGTNVTLTLTRTIAPAQTSPPAGRAIAITP